MTTDEMFEDIRTRMRGGESPIQAMYGTLTKAGSTCLPVIHPTERNLYVLVDCVPPESIRTIDFLAVSNNLSWRVQSLDNKAVIHISK
jgi:hypothetical protein